MKQTAQELRKKAVILLQKAKEIEKLEATKIGLRALNYIAQHPNATDIPLSILRGEKEKGK